MLTRWGRGVGLLLALAGAALWAKGLTVMQPLVEAAQPGRALYAENDTYWARDFRWMAVLAAVCALILAARGDRAVSIAVSAGGVGWLSLDTLLDRYDVAGAQLQVSATVVTCATVGVTWLLIQQRTWRLIARRWCSRRSSRRPSRPWQRTSTVLSIRTLQCWRSRCCPCHWCWRSQPLPAPSQQAPA